MPCSYAVPDDTFMPVFILLSVDRKATPVTSRYQQRATLTVYEAALQLGVGRNAAYDAVKRGEIPSIRIGRRLLVPVAALERMLAGEADR